MLFMFPNSLNCSSVPNLIYCQTNVQPRKGIAVMGSYFSLPSLIVFWCSHKICVAKLNSLEILGRIHIPWLYNMASRFIILCPDFGKNYNKEFIMLLSYFISIIKTLFDMTVAQKYTKVKTIQTRELWIILHDYAFPYQLHGESANAYVLV